MKTITITEQELNALIDQRLEERRKNTCMVKEVLNEFEEDLKEYDWTEHWRSKNYRGEPIAQDYSHTERHKVKSAISSLLKARFRVKSTAAIPSAKREQVREIVKKIIAVTKP